MADRGQLKILRQGAQPWNDLRGKLHKRPDLSNADLSKAYLSGTNLGGAELTAANLSKADLRHANLSGADLSGADLSGSNLSGADLSGANVSNANLKKANFRAANLKGANFSKANLSGGNFLQASLTDANFIRAILIEANLKEVNLEGANFSGADLSGAKVGWTIFANTDLSMVTGLDTLVHIGPSSVGIDTLYLSQCSFPDSFLRGCGVPDGFLEYLPALLAAVQPIQFYSCFISYSHQDEDFAKRLHSRMRDERLRVWYALENIQGGQKLHEQIFRAIQVHEKLLLVLSNHSMQSEWVETEIRRARKIEREENRRKLFPIRLIDFEAIQDWECFDADSGKDLAIELREYYMPDFSNWKDHDAFEEEFAKLLRDLKATET